ncbi:MAG TPA: amidohydrolase family protein [Candidatus Acidoferrales bacterium]
MRHILWWGFLLAVAAVAFAASPVLSGAEQEKKPEALKRIAIKAGKMLDVRSGRMLERQTILIEGDTIQAVGPNVVLPDGATLVDLSQATVLPGLIDAHTHLTYEPGDIGWQALGRSHPYEALVGAKNARLALLAGFTTVRNVGADGYSDVALRDAVNNGLLPGPRILASGPSLGITGGHCDSNLLALEFRHQSAGVANGPWEARAKVRENVKYGADLIKICATGGVMSKGDSVGGQQYTLEEMKAIVEEAHKLERKVAAHAHGAEGIKDAVRAGVDSIDHGSFLDDEGAQLMREHGTYLVPTIFLEEWIKENESKINLPDYARAKFRIVRPVHELGVARAIRSGVKIAFGTDAAVYPHGMNAREFAVLVRLGMTPLAAIQTATLNAAGLLGLEDRIGTIEAGKLADLIAVEGNPLEDVRRLENVRFVMKAGAVYKNDFTESTLRDSSRLRN